MPSAVKTKRKLQQEKQLQMLQKKTKRKDCLKPLTGPDLKGTVRTFCQYSYIKVELPHGGSQLSGVQAHSELAPILLTYTCKKTSF